MKRSPMPPRKTWMPRISVKRRANLAQRNRVRQDVHVRDDYRCQARDLVPHVECRGILDVHEVRRRSQDPGAWLNEDLCLTVCRTHHQWAHDHPADAYEVGLLLRGTV